MDGFKNSTRVQYMKGGDVSCYKKGGSVKGAAKIAKVMGEFKSGELHSGSKKGPKVTNEKQAMAIALSEANRKPMKKARGGSMGEGVSSRPVDSSGRRATNEDLGIERVKAPKPMGKGIGAAAAAMAAAKRVTDAMRAKGVPAHSDRPMIRRKAGGLATMPKGKC